MVEDRSGAGLTDTALLTGVGFTDTALLTGVGDAGSNHSILNGSQHTYPCEPVIKQEYEISSETLDNQRIC